MTFPGKRGPSFRITVPSGGGFVLAGGACCGARVNRNSALLREFDRLGVENLRAGLRHLLHFLVGKRVQPFCFRNHTRIGGIDAIDVGTNLAPLGVERRCHGHGCRVASAPAKGRHLFAIRNALIPGNDDDSPVGQFVLHAKGTHLDNSRIHVAVVGDDAGLAARETDGVASKFTYRHREQRHRDAFPGGKQHVQFASFRVRRDLPGHFKQMIGRVAHRGNDHYHLMPLIPRADDAPGHLAYFIGIGHTAAAVFLDDDRHPITLR